MIKKIGFRVLMIVLYLGAFAAFYLGLGWSFEPGLNISFGQTLLFCSVFFLLLPAINQVLIRKDKAGFKLFLIAVGGGALMALAWPPTPFALLIFAAMLPWFYIEHQVSNPASPHYGRNFFMYIYAGILAWNILATYWVANSTLPGAAVAFTLNSLLMTLPWLLFQRTKRILGPYLGYISLIAYFVTFEYLHMRWEITWPWLTLGNVFAAFPEWIQWYEYTGHLGGTVWVFAANILFFSGIVSLPFIRQYLKNRYAWNDGKVKAVGIFLAIARPLLVILVPILVSYILYATYQQQGKPVNVTTVQPNIDPYIKYSASRMEQIQKFIQLSERKITDSTDYVVWPESVLPSYVWLDRLEENREFNALMQFVNRHPQVTLIAGVSALEKYDEQATVTARYHERGKFWYDSYNAAMQIDTSGHYPIYKKSKLVPGVERLPYPSFTNFIAEYAFDFGGMTGSLGVQDTRDVFFNEDSIGVAPVICYESVFGDYMTGYFRNGAELIFVITNDGWWQNSPGHVQHMHYARLRAVEARRDVTRSANTGVSCFINQRGDLRQETTYWEDDVISSTMFANDELTFFTRYGDYVGRVSGFLTIFFVLYAFVRNRTQKTL